MTYLETTGPVTPVANTQSTTGEDSVWADRPATSPEQHTKRG